MYGIALDLGTSGFRAQLIDLETKETLKTVITMGHPLPGGNVMDHLDFAITAGENVAHEVIIETIMRMFLEFDIELSKVERLAVCGNPISYLCSRISKFGTSHTPEKTNRKYLGSRM